MKRKRSQKRIIIMGAGGREFHNFNVCFRNNQNYKVIAFTAAQIPNIENRIYPPELSGQLYPGGIPIFPEIKLPELIRKHKAEEVIFAYSDVSHLEIMHKASQVLSLGCGFRFLGPRATMLKSRIPVISVCAVRTGCGKSKLTLYIAKILRSKGKKVVIVRHPMPYGNLKRQICQRFENLNDLDKAECTIEEREEYEPLIDNGFIVFAGVDYKKVLGLAQKQADIILWDGGNNDFPFFKPNFHIVVCDPHRAGHEVLYHPGETNLLMADLVVINKTNTARKKDIAAVLRNVKILNPQAEVIFSESNIIIDRPQFVKNKTVLVVEDGPTVTHGEMSYGAGYLAAKRFGAKEILAPQFWAKGEIKLAFLAYPHLKNVLPALGYGEKQVKDLEATINSVPCEVVLSATPIDLGRIVKINKPLVRVGYEISAQGLEAILKKKRLF